MADVKQLKRLRRSVQEWNAWRQRRPDMQPDLSDANLVGAILIGADLSRVDLSRSKLIGTALIMTNFIKANLTKADLTNAFLGGTILDRTDLDDVNLSGTYFSYTTFAGVDLNRVKGLETAIHSGPSTVNIHSVALPQDEATRKHFLSGVGFTATQIESLSSFLIPRPSEYHSLFISYAHEDETFAQRLHTHLRKHDVPCWFAPHDLQPGNYFREYIDQAINTQEKVLLLLSEHSIKSGWVRYEVELTLARENRQQREILFPLRLDDAIFSCTASWAISLQATRHIGDFTGWQEEQRYQKAFDLLLRHLKTEVSPPHNMPQRT
jgi:uncharacterized protein YjbI with pentapeptide repeats